MISIHTFKLEKGEIFLRILTANSEDFIREIIFLRSDEKEVTFYPNLLPLPDKKASFRKIYIFYRYTNVIIVKEKTWKNNIREQ